MSCCGAQTYGASLPALVPGVAATFAVAELDGSATKKIRLLRIAAAATAATGIHVQDLRLVKLSSISTGGTPVLGVAVPFASSVDSPPAATAVFRGFTLAPTGGGVVVGALAVSKLTLDLITTLMPQPGPGIVWDFSNIPLSNRPTLKSATEAFSLDYNGATPGAGAASVDIYCWWTEQPLNA